MSEFDFSASFKQGQAAAEQAKASKAEIACVVTGLSEQLSAISEGKLAVEILEFSNAVTGFLDLSAAIRGTVDASVRKPEKALWLCARNPKAVDANPKRLAKWYRPHEGYPCVVTFDGNDIRCHDREGLERAFATMLQNAWVGEQLRELLDRPLKE